MQEITSASTVANGALCSALIDVLLDRKIITPDDGLAIVKQAQAKAGIFMQEPFAHRITAYFTDISARIAKRKVV